MTESLYRETGMELGVMLITLLKVLGVMGVLMLFINILPS